MMKSKMKETVKLHPFSTVLFAVYFAGRPRSSGMQRRQKQRSAA